jgi:hypothetical protein
MKRETWTFEPSQEAKSLLQKEMNRRAGRGGEKRGLRTKILNDALVAFLFSLKGKRELAK